MQWYFGFFEGWRNFGNPQNFGKFSLKKTGGRTYFTLLVDSPIILLFTQTKLVLVRAPPKK